MINLKWSSLRTSYTPIYTLCSFVLTNWTDEPASVTWDILSRTKITERLLPLRQSIADIPSASNTTRTHTNKKTTLLAALLCSLQWLGLAISFIKQKTVTLCACCPNLLVFLFLLFHDSAPHGMLHSHLLQQRLFMLYSEKRAERNRTSQQVLSFAHYFPRLLSTSVVKLWDRYIKWLHSYTSEMVELRNFWVMSSFYCSGIIFCLE